MSAFQTPQGGGAQRRDAAPLTVSLLFTPSSFKGGDGQKSGATDFRSVTGACRGGGGGTHGGQVSMRARAPPPQTHRRCTGLGRSPGGTPGAFSGRGGQGPTPPSITRRRSLTPASSRQMETPPPPPADSLLDSPTGLGAAPPTAWGVEPGGGE